MSCNSSVSDADEYREPGLGHPEYPVRQSMILPEENPAHEPVGVTDPTQAGKRTLGDITRLGQLRGMLGIMLNHVPNLSPGGVEALRIYDTGVYRRTDARAELCQKI